MSSPAGNRSAATIADLLAIPPDQRFHEIIDGELVRKAVPSGEHGDAQSALVTRIKGPFQRRPGGKFGIPHYWIVDPTEESLSVFRWTAEGYLLVLAADRNARVRAEPFEAVELSVGALFGEDEEGEE